MHCLKCGKQTKNEQVFCPGCLTVMEAYPVKPDVHIQLPKDANRESPKKSGRKRRAPSLEEQVVMLRRRSRRLVAGLLILALLLCAAGFLLMRTALSTGDAEWGKNYTFEISFD